MINFLYSNIVPGGIFILVIFVMRLLFKRLIPRWTFKVLELIAMMYMILPIRFSTSFSIYNHTASNVVSKSSNPNSLSIWITILWVIGGIICFLIVMRNYIEVHGISNRAIPLINSDHKITKNDNIFYSDEISSPISSGIIRKKIIFPKRLVSLDPQQLKYIIRHENFHNQFQDNLIKFVSMMFLCIYWFHPCVWLLIYMLYNDIEIVCDEAVVKNFDKEQRSAYANAIIKFSSRETGELNLWFAGFSKNKIEERIEKVMKKKKSPLISVLSVGIILSLSFMFATSPRASVGNNSEDFNNTDSDNNVKAVDIDGIVIYKFQEKG